MKKVFISVNYDTGDYIAEESTKTGFKKLYEGGVLSDIVKLSKDYIERNGKHGSVVVMSDIYSYKKGEWIHVETVRF